MTDSGAAARLAARRELRQEAAARRRRRRRRLGLLLVVVALLSPVVYSYTSTMLQPSSLPLGVRSVEWLRSHHGNWLVDEVEQRLLRLEGAEEGRPAAEDPARRSACDPGATVPTARAHSWPERTPRSSSWPPPIKPVFAHPLPGRGSLEAARARSSTGARRCS